MWLRRLVLVDGAAAGTQVELLRLAECLIRHGRLVRSVHVHANAAAALVVDGCMPAGLRLVEGRGGVQK